MSRRSRTLVLVGVLSLLIQAVPAMSLSTGGNGPAQVSGGELPGGDTKPISVAPVVRAPADTVLLPAPANGADALTALGDSLDEAAARNGMSTARLEEILANDDTAWVDRRGLVYYVEPIPPAPAIREKVGKGPFPFSETFKLHSKPGSNKVIYLDFNGHTIEDSAWHLDFPGTPNPWKASSFDTNGNPNAFSNGEKNQIQSIWQRVAEDYAPFDVDVTTEAPPKADITRSGPADQKYGTRVVITDSSGLCSAFCGGVAYIGAVDVYTNVPFPGVDHDYLQPAWVFDNSLSDEAKYIAEAVSHEAGHNLGLNHDGQGALGYYEGHEPWAPIMGVGYYQPVVQWSKGEYTNPTNTENDFAVMASHGIVERADDHTNSTATATPFAGTQTGVIASEADFDTFEYLAPSNTTATFTATRAPVSPNLDIVLRVYASDGVTLLAESRPVVARVSEDVASGMNATINLAVTKGTVYYVQVSGDSYQTPADGYSKYGSIGQYTLAATPASPSCNGQLATIFGTGGADNLSGTGSKDVIAGLGGNDTINGLGGNDLLCGNGGADTVNGGAGADTLLGAEGSDDLNGGDGADLLRGGAAADDLNGGAGPDDLFGDGGNDKLTGGAGGGDVCTGGPGTDTSGGGCEVKKTIP